MIWLIGIIVFCGFATGIYSLVRISKVKGMAELTLSSLCLIITILFSSLQNSRAFGGTKWDFFLHSVTVDGDILPWVLFILFISVIIFVMKTIFIVVKKNIYLSR